LAVALSPSSSALFGSFINSVSSAGLECYRQHRDIHRPTNLLNRTGDAAYNAWRNTSLFISLALKKLAANACQLAELSEKVIVRLAGAKSNNAQVE
jgi:hypothetical protein